MLRNSERARVPGDMSFALRRRESEEAELRRKAVGGVVADDHKCAATVGILPAHGGGGVSGAIARHCLQETPYARTSRPRPSWKINNLTVAAKRQRAELPTVVNRLHGRVERPQRECVFSAAIHGKPGGQVGTNPCD